MKKFLGVLGFGAAAWFFFQLRATPPAPDATKGASEAPLTADARAQVGTRKSPPGLGDGTSSRPSDSSVPVTTGSAAKRNEKESAESEETVGPAARDPRAWFGHWKSRDPKRAEEMQAVRQRLDAAREDLISHLGLSEQQIGAAHQAEEAFTKRMKELLPTAIGDRDAMKALRPQLQAAQQQKVADLKAAMGESAYQQYLQQVSDLQHQLLPGMPNRPQGGSGHSPASQPPLPTPSH